jgi:hypothetical protein
MDTKEPTVTVKQAGDALAAVHDEQQRNKRRKVDHHQQLPLSAFRHDDALAHLKRDYLGDDTDPRTPLRSAADFQLMFGLSRDRFQVLMEDVMASNIPFFKSTVMDGLEECSLAARLLLPLKTMKCKISPHAFIDYFQMPPQYAMECCEEFDKALKTIYKEEKPAACLKKIRAPMGASLKQPPGSKRAKKELRLATANSVAVDRMADSNNRLAATFNIQGQMAAMRMEYTMHKDLGDLDAARLCISKLQQLQTQLAAINTLANASSVTEDHDPPLEEVDLTGKEVDLTQGSHK